MQIEITDVFLRDGLQDVDVVVPTADKLETAARLIAAGVQRLEVASFVNPKKVPQMADAEAVFAGLPCPRGLAYTSLALNGRGSSGPSTPGRSTLPSLPLPARRTATPTPDRASKKPWPVLVRWSPNSRNRFFAGISTAFTCPFEGNIAPEHLLRVVRAFKTMGIATIGLADTLGTTPTEQAFAAWAMSWMPNRIWTIYCTCTTRMARRCPRVSGRRPRNHPLRQRPRRLRRMPLRARSRTATSPPKNSSGTCTPPATTPASTRHGSPKPCLRPRFAVTRAPALSSFSASH